MKIHPTKFTGLCQDNGNRSNQESKFDFLVDLCVLTEVSSVKKVESVLLPLFPVVLELVVVVVFLSDIG